MSARRETASQAATVAEPEAKKRTRSEGVLAGQLFSRLCAIDAEEATELAASPETIKAKHEARRGRAMAEAGEEVRLLVGKMRA